MKIDASQNITSQTPIVDVTKIHKSFEGSGGRLEVLRDVTLSVAQAETLVIMGPSGSGKSTLLHIIGTLEPPTSGRVSISGENPFTFNERGLAGFRNRSLGFVFQD